MQAPGRQAAAGLLPGPAVAAFALDLNRSILRRLFVLLSLANVAFAATTAAFIVAWERLDTFTPGVQRFIKYGLVQGHLATENVVAAWYSSMLLLAVGLAALAAFGTDGQRAVSRLRLGWLVMGAAFVTLSLDEIGSFHERLGMVRALSTSADRAVGWVFVLAIPIALVGLFLLAFAWFHVRTAPGAFWWMATGIALFLANPVFEAVEMNLIHGAGADAATWQRTVHDVLLVFEEGVLELFGVCCFLLAVLSYLAFTTGGRPRWTASKGRIKGSVRLLTVLMTLGVFASAAIVDRLPRGDTGIPSNWFPAAMFFTGAVALGALQRDIRPRARIGLVIGALALSGFCGAGLYGYSRLLFFGAPLAAAFATVVAGWMLEGFLESEPSSTPV